MHVGKIKVMAWRGPDAIISPVWDEAGVGWILAENWWPYQRPSFVTPPSRGMLALASTFSRAAAEILTAITGDPFFPGGMGVFPVTQNQSWCSRTVQAPPSICSGPRIGTRPTSAA